MKKIRTTIGVAALVVSLSACTPDQVQYWLHRKAAAEATPDLKDDELLKADLAAVQAAVPNTVCNEWFWTAIEAGFTFDQWVDPVSWIMDRESNCEPWVQSYAGAIGLMQDMPMWADDCGGVPHDLFDPLFNLRCAVHIYEVQGWYAWSTYHG